MFTMAKQMWVVRAAVMVVMVCVFAGNASGSCLSYGHSCWGAHGKRSELPQNIRVESPQWFLSKLLAANVDLDDGVKGDRVMSNKPFAPILAEPVDPWRSLADASDDLDLSSSNLDVGNFNDNAFFTKSRYPLKKPQQNGDNFKFENSG